MEVIRKNTTCSFTGHRRFKKGVNIDNIRRMLREEIISAIHDGYTDFISGMAVGADIMAAEEVIALSEEYPDISLVCAVPFRGQQNSWPALWQERYKKCLEKAAMVMYFHDAYVSYSYQERNRYMVDNSSRLIAVYNGESTGGTANTLEYAIKKMLDIRIINC